ncbi:type II 3-dehydroquinate dehydratase [Anaerococcus hydrogenalis]|uniref:3-dehydroquinate dehydratase n=2 Tax=Anaerococcus hydrogenalis TaxID=33029 RepID=F0H2V9_9FIRM|nr:type II 3-dehydroquinate dehydratase [Anaerococcus hydrogenalis]EGC83186.1 3-dehydroquinate dehydratase, type II [Anaerococcus hydrogenalis ACS-025-V-Sch4]MDK7695046.1 type II 3-dehydroquinate dehydratase [Anaerococcus hydrogenalis]MDK7696979.1 type II 3-dehydroquinate dehydratase [Anaerococcus hydrogenalis]MDK7708073.1 type II 3-dehydroquinate dehydratase [Anaerococcus hydrogenalis]PMC81968.1 type II 3-dehydroquinate dehydratase [Anaerococcus hydrogenalis]
MRILVINGPNINMLGIRERELYGNKTYKDLIKCIKDYTDDKDIEIEIYQSNSEGQIINKIQEAYKLYDGIVINPAAYTHTSVAILDALKAVNIPTVEVHLTDVDNREEFRKISYVSYFAKKTIKGKGFEGYIEAIDYLKENFK